MGQANSLPKQLEVFTKQHMNFLLQIKHQPALLADSERSRNALQRYIKFMENKALYGHGAYKDALLDEIWMWHIHRIHPVKYINDCTSAFGYVIPLKSPSPLPPVPSPLPKISPSIDLISCVGKHREFISKVEPLFTSTDEHIQFLANQYLKFLKLVPLKEPGKSLIPTIGIDLIWHTHMMIPESYAKDTKEIAGVVLDHDHYHNGNDFQANLAYTDELWQKHYKEPYVQNKHGTATPASDGMAVSHPPPPSPTTSPTTQQPIVTAATETVLAPTVGANFTTTNNANDQLASPPTPTNFDNQPPLVPSPTYNPAAEPNYAPPPASETLTGVKNEVTWDQDSGSNLWLGWGWGDDSSSSSTTSTSMYSGGSGSGSGGDSGGSSSGSSGSSGNNGAES